MGESSESFSIAAWTPVRMCPFGFKMKYAGAFLTDKNEYVIMHRDGSTSKPRKMDGRESFADISHMFSWQGCNLYQEDLDDGSNRLFLEAPIPILYFASVYQYYVSIHCCDNTMVIMIIYECDIVGMHELPYDKDIKYVYSADYSDFVIFNPKDSTIVHICFITPNVAVYRGENESQNAKCIYSMTTSKVDVIRNRDGRIYAISNDREAKMVNYIYFNENNRYESAQTTVNTQNITFGINPFHVNVSTRNVDALCVPY